MISPDTAAFNTRNNLINYLNSSALNCPASGNAILHFGYIALNTTNNSIFPGVKKKVILINSVS